MAHGHPRGRREGDLGRIAVFVLGCTGALTLSFIGLVAFATGNTAGVIDRVPYYVLGAAVVFVGTIVGLEQRGRDGRSILRAAAMIAGVAFGFFVLGGEGFVYGARNPGEAFAAQQFLYLVAAGLIGTGIGYWGSRHRETIATAFR